MKQRIGQSVCLLGILAILCGLFFCFPSLSAEEQNEVLVKRLEAESAGGSLTFGEDEGASGGRFAGVDHTLVGDNNTMHYWLEFTDVPETTKLVMRYATQWQKGEVLVYVRSGEKTKLIGGIAFASTGAWIPDEENGEDAELEAYIPAGSHVLMAFTGSLNIDYFDLYYRADSPVASANGTQEASLKEQNNAFISDLKWLLPAPASLEWATTAERDASLQYSDLEVAGRTFDKGICMLSGHYDGASCIEVNIKDLDFTTFASYVGISDDSEPSYVEPSVIFIVEADGRELIRSDVMRQGDEAVLLKADITGAEILRLSVSPAGDGVGLDAAVWGLAAIGKTDNEEELFATPEPTTAPTQNVTPTPVVTPGPTASPEGSGVGEKEPSGGSWWIYAIAAVAVVAAAVGAVLLIRKKKA